jgi:hypothetical protein
MISSTVHRRKKAGRRIFRLESLEPRHLLSVTLPPGIASVSPSDGSVLTQTPQNLVVTFDQPGTAYGAAYFDFQIYPVIDGVVQTGSPVFGSPTMLYPPPENADPPGAPQNGTVLEIPLELDGLTLPGGTYQINIVGQSSLEQQLAGPGIAPWSSGNDVPLTQFSLPYTSGITLSQPTANLGTIGSTVDQVWGSLDSSDVANAVDLYQISLAAGHFWQLGLSVSAHAIGSSLLSDLTLFDSQGNVIASATTGLSSDPKDPYLFSGLNPGTYYVGVSASTNQAYGSGGYNPLTGLQGIAGLNQPGGSFELSLLAQPHDQSTHLVSFSLDRADAAESSPTGLTLAFSAPLSLSNLFQPDVQQTAVEVVDSSGRIWPSTAEQYQVSDATLTLIFDEPLPAGQYSLIVPSQGGLTDLAGQPVTASGESPEVLASWTVTPGIGSAVQNNLGIIWPSTLNRLIGLGAFSQTTLITADKNVTYRWVVTVPGFFVLQTQNSSGSLAIQNSGSGGTTVLDAGSTPGLNTYVMFLNDGVYDLRFTNLDSRPVSVSWALTIGSLDWEKIVDNGVGQGSALSLMAFTPAPVDSDANSALNAPALAQFEGSVAFAGAMGPVPLSLLVTVNTSPLGQPSLDAGLVPTADPGETGLVTVADRTPGFFAGFQPGAMIATFRAPGEADLFEEFGRPLAKVVLNDKAVQTTSAGGGNLDVDRARADLIALAGDDWLVRLVSRVKSNLVRLAGGSEIMAPAAESSGILATTGGETSSKSGELDDRNLTRRSSSVVQADFGSVASLVIGAAIVRRLWRPIQKKWRAVHPSAVAAQRPAGPFYRRPHVLAGARSPSGDRKARLLRR